MDIIIRIENRSIINQKLRVVDFYNIILIDFHFLAISTRFATFVEITNISVRVYAY